MNDGNLNVYTSNIKIHQIAVNKWSLWDNDEMANVSKRSQRHK